MSRRAAAIALALAVLAAVVLWALRPGEDRTPAARSRVAAADAAPRDSSTGAPARAVVAPAAPAPSAPAATPPAPEAAAPAPRADRVPTPEEQALRSWGPKGRVVEAGTGKPLAWWVAWIQVRRRDDSSLVEVRYLDPPSGDGAPESRAAFDLALAAARRGDAALAGLPVDALEYRIGVNVAGHRPARTPWRPLVEGPRAGELTLPLEPDPMGTIVATLRTADGRPYRGKVQARVADDGLDLAAGWSGDTDAEGRTSLREVPSGEQQLRVAALTREDDAWHLGPVRTEPQRLLVPAGGTVQAEFTVPATGEIAISWLDASGAPLERTGAGWNTVVDGRGGYSMRVERIVGLPTGPATLRLHAPGCRPWSSTVDVVAGQVTKVEARFEPGEDPK